MDTRVWSSWGTVAQDTPEQPSVRFKDETGAVIPDGPYVAVDLHPWGHRVQCRVSSMCAGVGESEWHPFVQGDEVLVSIPEGNFMAGCMIVGRANNALDQFPAIVAGQDATANNFGFKRMRAPFIIETASSYLIRSAVTGAQFGIDQTGQVIFNDGDGSRFFMGPDAVGFTSADGTTSIQVLQESKQIALNAANGASSFLIDGAASQFATTGTFSISTTGLLGLGHAVTLEQVVSILVNLIGFLAQAPVTAFNPTSPLGTLWSSGGVAALDVAFAAALAAAVTPAPYTAAGVPGGFLGTGFPLTITALQVALASPFPAADPTGLTPGIGRPGFMY